MFFHCWFNQPPTQLRTAPFQPKTRYNHNGMTTTGLGVKLKLGPLKNRKAYSFLSYIHPSITPLDSWLCQPRNKIIQSRRNQKGKTIHQGWPFIPLKWQNHQFNTQNFNAPPIFLVLWVVWISAFQLSFFVSPSNLTINCGYPLLSRLFHWWRWRRDFLLSRLPSQVDYLWQMTTNER